MKTLSDSLNCMAFTACFYLTLASFGLFLMGLWSWIQLATGFPTSATGLQVFAVLLVGGLFTLLGTIGLGKIWDALLNR